MSYGTILHILYEVFRQLLKCIGLKSKSKTTTATTTNGIVNTNVHNILYAEIPFINQHELLKTCHPESCTPCSFL